MSPHSYGTSSEGRSKQLIVDDCFELLFFTTNLEADLCITTVALTEIKSAVELESGFTYRV